MKKINKELLEQLNLKQRSGESPRTKVTEATDFPENAKGAASSNVIHQTEALGSGIEDSILDAGSIHPNEDGGELRLGDTSKMANTAKASFFRNKSSQQELRAKKQQTQQDASKIHSLY